MVEGERTTQRNKYFRSSQSCPYFLNDKELLDSIPSYKPNAFQESFTLQFRNANHHRFILRQWLLLHFVERDLDILVT
jgi:hypothetical protein